MKLALKIARVRKGLTGSNPSVGCLIVKDNRIISIGQTGYNGRPHAEYNAIEDSNETLMGSKMYVTLEPCNHYGKTPPCTKKIIKSGINEIIYSMNDIDKRVKGKSFKILSKYKIKVKRGLLKDEAKKLYDSYIKNRLKKLPFVTAKIAISKNKIIYTKGIKRITNKYSDKLSRLDATLIRRWADLEQTDKQTVDTLGITGGFIISNEILKKDFILRPSMALDFGYDLSPSSDVSLNYVSDSNTKYTKSINQEDDESIKGKIGFDILNETGLSMMFFYERFQTENSHSDTLYFFTGYVTHRNEEFVVELENETARINFNQDINGFDVKLSSNYNLLSEIDDYGATLEVAKKF